MEDPQANSGTPGRNWIDYVALVISFIATFFSVAWAIVFLVSLRQNPNQPTWPLPGLVLLEWALIGLAALVAMFFAIWARSPDGVTVFWLCVGGLVPMAILGAFSIGLSVEITFLIFLVAGIIFLLRRKSAWLKSLGMLLLGGVLNLAILLLIIFLSSLGQG